MVSVLLADVYSICCNILQHIAYAILLTCENVCDIDYCIPHAVHCGDVGDILNELI